MTGSSSGERSASEAASLVFRIATVGLSLASAIMTATSTQCLYDDGGRPAATVSYSDYPSFRYAAVADLLSAVLQGLAICLEVARRKKAAKAVELIDKLVLALTSTSAALLLAVDEITSCGPPSSRRGRRGRQGGSACDQAGAFCRWVRVSSALSLAAAVSVSVSIYTRRAPEAVPVVVTAEQARRRPPAPAPRILPPPDSPKTSPPDSPKSEPSTNTSDPPCPPPPPVPPTECETNLVPAPAVVPPSCPPPPPLPPTECGTNLVPAPAVVPPSCPPPPPLPPTECGTNLAPAPAVVPPWCQCPRLTIPCPCENSELCRAFF